MKTTITILAFCLIGKLSLAQQAPSIEWQKVLGGTDYDYANNIALTSDGGYIVATNSYSNDVDVIGNHGSEDIWLVKLNAIGVIEWQKTIGGSSLDFVNKIESTTDGGYIMVGGTSSSDGDVSGNHESGDAWVVKLSSTGMIEWQNFFGGTGYDGFVSFQLTSDGGVLAVGWINSSGVVGSHGGEDALVVKLTSTGTLEWQKVLGGSDNDAILDVQTISGGGYIMVGETFSNDGDVSGNHGYEDVWVVKVSSLGLIEWQNCYGGSYFELGNSIIATADGGCIIAGHTESNDGDISGNHGYLDIWVVKIGATGALEWQKTIGGTNSEYAFSIVSTLDGNYVVAGYTASNDGDISGNHGGEEVWVVELNSSGDLYWQKCLGGTNDEGAFNIKITTDGGCIIAGSAASNDGNVIGNNGSYDAWVVKLGSVLDISTFNIQALTLYPNPTSGLLQLLTSNNTIFDNICITDSTGKTVLEQTQNTTQVDVEQLASGLYIIKAFSGEEVFVNKFVKE